MCYEFLPPYSPDYNPIELLFSAMKYQFHCNGDYVCFAITELLKDDVHIALGAIFANTLEDVFGWFKHCDYVCVSASGIQVNKQPLLESPLLQQKSDGTTTAQPRTCPSLHLHAHPPATHPSNSYHHLPKRHASPHSLEIQMHSEAGQVACLQNHKPWQHTRG